LHETEMEKDRKKLEDFVYAFKHVKGNWIMSITSSYRSESNLGVIIMSHDTDSNIYSLPNLLKRRLAEAELHSEKWLWSKFHRICTQNKTLCTHKACVSPLNLL
jgi:hypothetical protein